MCAYLNSHDTNLLLCILNEAMHLFCTLLILGSQTKFSFQGLVRQVPSCLYPVRENSSKCHQDQEKRRVRTEDLSTLWASRCIVEFAKTPKFKISIQIFSCKL